MAVNVGGIVVGIAAFQMVNDNEIMLNISSKQRSTHRDNFEILSLQSEFTGKQACVTPVKSGKFSDVYFKLYH